MSTRHEAMLKRAAEYDSMAREAEKDGKRGRAAEYRQNARYLRTRVAQEPKQEGEGR